MKHIVFVIGHYKNGGVAMRATNLANEFGKRGHKVTILVTKEIAEDIFFERHSNVEIVSLSHFYDEHKTSPAVRGDAKKQTRAMRRIKWLRNIQKKGTMRYQQDGFRLKGMEHAVILRTYAVLHPGAIFIAFGSGCYEDAFFATRGLPCKLIYAERNAPHLELPWNIAHRDMLMNSLKQIDGVVLQTEDERLFYQDVLPANAEVIHNPIKPSLPEPYEGERRRVVVNFCRIANQKNLPLMIEAFVKLHADHPDYRLEIYGNTVEQNEEQLRDELIDFINSQGYSEFISILPPAADVHEQVRDAAMFVSSSDFEGLSNSMIEAMAIGLPCVCTDCLGGGAREMIRHEENGLLVPTQDAEALCCGMKRFVEDLSLAATCGRNATKLRKELCADRIFERWLKLIEKV